MASSYEILYVRNSQQDSDNTAETAVVKAARIDYDEIAAMLINKLISAVEDQNEDIVKSLLDEFFNTSDIFVKSRSSDSDPLIKKTKFATWRRAISIATKKDTKYIEEIVKLLYDCDFMCSLETDVDIVSLLARFETKVDDKALRLNEMLLKSGKIKVNARDNQGRTAMHYAEDEKFVSLLIHYGADVNIKDNEGRTPLMWYRSVSVLQAIMKEARTEDLDAVDCNGRTALMSAVCGALPETVELLLNAGASVNLSDHLGFTALHHALYTNFDHYDHFPRNSKELKKRKEIFTILFDKNYVEVGHEHCDWYMKFKTRKDQKMKILEMLLGRPDIDVNALSFEKFSPLDSL